jgi:serine protease SohB
MFLLPFDRRPRVALVRLSGAISARPGFGGGLSLSTAAPSLDRAFGLRRVDAVFLALNSPGGSPVQSSLIAAHIRRLADEKKVPVVACVEDAAASGGYWIACAADEIVADPLSILGSIGVISAGFGFQDAIARIGVERRLRTAGTEKSFLDPSARSGRRTGRACGAVGGTARRVPRLGVVAARDVAEGAGRRTVHRPLLARPQAVELGLADRLGDARGEAKRRFGPRCD